MEKSDQNMEFLQSDEWRDFQEAAGRKTIHLEKEGFAVNIIRHRLPVVGEYFYAPKWPSIQSSIHELIDLAKKEKIGWIRIEPADVGILELTRKNISEKIVKAPHDMQPKEIFVIDITKSEEQLLTEMKPKTRYNIGIAKKKGVEIRFCSKADAVRPDFEKAFIELTREMAFRQGIIAHPAAYYRKMIETLPSEMLKIYVAEYAGKIIAANLMLLYGNTATYLHGASSNEHRNVMAPFLLQWRMILDAKNIGCTHYDFGGVKTGSSEREVGNSNSWAGITKFKTGFSPNTQPVVFPGSYDIVINPWKYASYRSLQKIKELLVKIQK